MPAEHSLRHAAEIPGAPAATRFGARLAGVPVLFPEGEMLEFLPEVPLWRLPLGPRRVSGLMQLRGHPVPVFDPSPDAGRHDPPARAPVLVVGASARAAALLLEGPPEAFEPAGDAPARQGSPQGDTDLEAALDSRLASICFRGALGEPVRDRSGMRWWPVEPDRLFESLASEADDE